MDGWTVDRWIYSGILGSNPYPLSSHPFSLPLSLRPPDFPFLFPTPPLYFYLFLSFFFSSSLYIALPSFLSVSHFHTVRSWRHIMKVKVNVRSTHWSRDIFFYRGTLCVSAVFAVARCPSVCHVGPLYPDG